MADDVQAEILEMNSYGMHLCQEKNFAEAQECLETAYLRLQGDASGEHQMLVDRLKATTLNNLGVVECHKGDHVKSLNHLEAAQMLEIRSGVSSPSTLLNLCAVHNAVGNYEKAAALALDAIEMLKISDQGLNDDNKALWGAAWHNLGIAELNMQRQGRGTRGTEVLSIFRNAMSATGDLLGAKHPMTVAVHDTYRAVRDSLKEQGVFRERTSGLPPIAHEEPNSTRIRQLPAYVKPQTPAKAQRGISNSLYRPTTTNNGMRRVYQTSHPLIKNEKAAKTPRRLPALGDNPNSREGTARSQASHAPQHAVPNPPSPRKHAPHPPARGEGADTGRRPQERRVSELLLGDMWVEIQVPRHSPTGTGFSPVRPSYGEALYVIEPSDPVVESIAQPSAHAHVDHQEPVVRDEPGELVQENSTATAQLASALGDDIARYPALAAAAGAAEPPL